MKSIKIVLSLFLIVSVFTFTSCETEPIDSALNPEDFANPTPAGPAAFKADFSGATWNGSAAMAEISQNFIQIVGYQEDGDAFTFMVGATGVGTYPANTNLLAYTPAGAEFGYWSTNPDNPAENTGSITITEINTANHTISGTFNFKGYWSDPETPSILPVQFTNGTFTNVPYTTTSGSESEDSFFAKVDGVEFVEDQITGAFVSASGVPDYISVAGSKDNSDGIYLGIAASLPVGTYQFTGPFGNEVKGSCVINDVLYNAESGTVTITSKTSERITGTFSMVAKNFTTSETKTVSQGSFDVAY